MIDAYPRPDVPIKTVRHLFLAQVWPMLVSHWGNLVLHASALNIGGHAVAFVGQTGWGKSTLAGSLNRHGYPLITDDILALAVEADEHQAVPSYAEQRLWGNSADTLFGPNREWSPVAHYTDKVSVDLASEGRLIEERPLPLVRIYALEPPEAADEVISIEPFTLSQAYVRLLDQTFRLDITDQERMRLEVEQLGNLVRAVPVRRLTYPRRYDALDGVRAAILDDVNKG